MHFYNSITSVQLSHKYHSTASCFIIALPSFWHTSHEYGTSTTCVPGSLGSVGSETFVDCVSGNIGKTSFSQSVLVLLSCMRPGKLYALPNWLILYLLFWLRNSFSSDLIISWLTIAWAFPTVRCP